MSFRIKYFIPEDGDEFDHPNVFTLTSNGGSPTLLDVKRSFPVPGRYHFRFLRTLNDTKVWIDLANENDSVPIFDGQIIAKISRLSGPNTTTNAASSRSIPSSQSAPTRVQAAPEQPKSLPSKPPKVASLIDDQDDVFGLSNGGPVQNAASASEPDLLGISSSTAPVAQTASNPDLFGLDNFASTPAPTRQAAPAPAPAIQLQRSGNSNSQINQSFGAPQSSMPMRGQQGGPMGMGAPMGAPMGMGGPMGGQMGGGQMGMQQPTRGIPQPSSARGAFDSASSKQGINIDPFGNLGGVQKK